MSGLGKVLIVDDEPEVRALAARALQQCGLVCDQAGDGQEAINRAKGGDFEAVVTDLRMPTRHGHALCGDLLGLAKPPGVMVLTGLSDARLVRDLMSRGVHDVIQKPVAYDVLAMKVLAMIEQRRRAAQVAATPAKKKPKAASRATTTISLLHKIESTLDELTQLFEDRLDDVFPAIDDLPEPPRAVRDFIRRLAENDALSTESGRPVANHEARRMDRVTCYTTVIAAPVDRRWRPTCEPFKVALRDVSESGLRLLHTRATNAEYLALSWNATQLAAKQLRVVTKVMRVKPCSPFYDIGGQFVLAD